MCQIETKEVMKVLEGHKVTNPLEETFMVVPNVMQESVEVMMNVAEVIVVVIKLQILIVHGGHRNSDYGYGSCDRGYGSGNLFGGRGGFGGQCL